MKTIVFTGGGSAGHVTPNLALIAELERQGWGIHYIGSESGIEKDIIEREGIPFYPISSGKLRRYFDLKNFKDPFKVLKGVYDSYRLIRKLKPSIVFSKGGFVSVPVVLGSRMCGVPVIIHESDMTPGLANKISIPFAAKVCVTFPETLQHIQGEKAVLTGLPIRQTIAEGNAQNGRQLCDFHTQKPVIMVMGGSLGSQAINQAVRDSLPRLLSDFQIVHICGKGNISLAHEHTRGYKQFEYVSGELPDLMAMVDFVVSRAGATSIFEFLLLEKPMLLIPLSRSASRGDQILNAESFQKAGYADVLQEEELSADSLCNRIFELSRNSATYKEQMANNRNTDAVHTIIEMIGANRLPT
jgi:UDP-N-acetylglucosamine--N-acetylmuramyl-(pentapeptide) pyrophosphoryl-undecaprenol N-acetylglucosamine transferase